MKFKENLKNRKGVLFGSIAAAYFLHFNFIVGVINFL